jgi:DNA processing protein
MVNQDKKYWVGFNHIPGIGRVRLTQLLNHFDSLETAWRATSEQFRQAGLDASSIDAISHCRPGVSPDAEMEKLERLGVKIVTCREDSYPARLKEIYDYPPLLYMRGSLEPSDEWCLALVGTRRPTAYGRQITEEIVTELARNKITIVSGLARGIDSVAHRSALAAGGRSIAVLASGVDIIYPAENAGLAANLMEDGALISEYPLGCRPRPEYFPRRNRIISGLCLGVLVIEAGQGSGALITANLALEQNREVFAIPGSILSMASKGTNHLIQEGAKLVTDCADILKELNLTTVARQLEMRTVLPASGSDEALLLAKMGAESSHIDQICRSSGLPIATVSGLLTMMELKGLVRQTGAMNYVLAKEAREHYRVDID